ncbi:MAG: hypothetical protein DRN27_05800 [Thermoplasmata archaeon]|nr:MAG: hypothetical protein DRN27_05800 [Thermoplasmata archaeon]
MTDIEIINKILKSKKPSDILSGEWKDTYKHYSRMVHPDMCNHPDASTAMAKLNEYKDLINNGRQSTDETGDFRVFEKKIVYKVTDKNRALIRKSFENFKLLKLNTDKASVGFHRYLPESMRLSKNELIINFKDRAVPLTGEKLPQHHVNWVFSRMFEILMWFRKIGYSHMGMNPTTVFVVPETHGVIITSFYHMTHLDHKAETISAKYKMWYPTTLFTKKIATQDIDLELAKKIALYLLGDRSAAGTKLKRDKDVNQEILNFLLTKHECELDDYEKYREIIKKNFKRKFYPLDL